MFTGDVQYLYHEKFPLLKVLIQALYEIPDCGTGGMLHAIVDDNNIQDIDIESMLEEFHDNEDYYKNRVEYELAILICNLLLKLSFEQRCALFVIIEHDFPADKESFNKILDVINVFIDDYYNM